MYIWARGGSVPRSLISFPPFPILPAFIYGARLVILLLFVLGIDQVCEKVIQASVVYMLSGNDNGPCGTCSCAEDASQGLAREK